MSLLEPPGERPSGEGLPSTGDVIDGRYQIEERLGYGGMGAVFAAHDAQTGQRVAIKIMLAEEARQADGAKRFMREARAARAIDDAHVARVMDAGELPSGLPYMVMELLVGRGLDKVIAARAPLPIPLAVDYLLQACEGVARAHALGIIHRDIKPSNLFETQCRDGRVLIKVLDFGIAKATVQLDPNTDATSLTESSSTLGSPKYMSPEQLRCSKSVDVRTDIWSLGLILHLMLTGKAAFEADNVGAQFAMIISDPPAKLRDQRPDAPVGLEEIVLCCLEKDVAYRYQDVGQLAEALLPFAPEGAAERIARIRGALDIAGVSSPSLPERSSWEQADVGPPSESATTRRWRSAETSGTARSWDTSTPTTGRPQRRGWPVVAAAVGAAVLAVGAYHLFVSPAATVAQPEAEGLSGATAATESDAPGEAGSSLGSAEPAAAATVEIHLTLDPADARVELDGAVTEGNPIELPLSKRTYDVAVSAPGYVTEHREVSAHRDAQLEIRLRRRSSAPRPPPRSKPEPEPRAPPTAAPAAARAPTATPTKEPAIEPKGPLVETL